MSSEKKEDICNRPDCNWVLVSKETMSYACLRCGKKLPPPPKPKEKPKEPSPPPVVLLIALVVALFISLIFSSAESRSYQPTNRHHYHWPYTH